MGWCDQTARPAPVKCQQVRQWPPSDWAVATPPAPPITSLCRRTQHVRAGDLRHSLTAQCWEVMECDGGVSGPEDGPRVASYRLEGGGDWLEHHLSLSLPLLMSPGLPLSRDIPFKALTTQLTYTNKWVKSSEMAVGLQVLAQSNSSLSKWWVPLVSDGDKFDFKPMWWFLAGFL